MNKKINEITLFSGRKKKAIPVEKDKINHIGISLSNGIYFEINVDNDGDILITTEGKSKVCFDEVNQVCIEMKK